MTAARYLALLQELFGRVDAGELPAVTSGVTLLEVLVVPYRSGDLALAERYESLLHGVAASRCETSTGRSFALPPGFAPLSG